MLEEEKDWEITMDQFSSIISNLNLINCYISVHLLCLYFCKSVCKNFKNIMVCMGNDIRDSGIKIL